MQPGEHRDRRDYPLPKIGATGTQVWHDGSTHDFVVLSHYRQEHDVRDFSGQTHERLPEWRVEMVTKCKYTSGPSEGSTFYLWRGRWNSIELHTHTDTP